MDDVIYKLIQNCSTLTKIERTVAYYFRFISNSQRKLEDRVLDGLTMQELTRAQNTLIKYSQNSFFKEDIFHLQKQGQVKLTSKLLQLQAFLDKDGIIRVGGRLQEALWNFARKHPILLPAKCKLTRLIIEREHRKLLYAGPLLLLASIRQRYWPLNARNLMRQICRACVKASPKGLTQTMGSLSSARISPAHAFNITGIDYAGPIIMLVNKSRGRKTCI